MRSRRIIRCERCGKYWEVHKYIHRVNLDDLDVEDFRPWSRLGIDLCYQCNKALKDFIFGKPEEDKEVPIDEIKRIQESRGIVDPLVLEEENDERRE